MPRPPLKPMEDTTVTPDEMQSVRRAMKSQADAGVAPKKGRATSAGKGKKGRKTPDGKFVSTHEIVEQVRVLLIRGHTPAEIKRGLCNKFGGRGRSFEKHISVARERNLQVISKTLPEAKSESVSIWYSSLRDAMDFRDKVKGELAKCQAGLDATQRAIDSESGKSSLERLKEEREEWNERYGLALERLTYFESRVAFNQDKLDRLLGTMAPIELKADVKMQFDDQPQPLTHEEAQSELLLMVQTIKERASAEAKQAVTTPSTN